MKLIAGYIGKNKDFKIIEIKKTDKFQKRVDEVKEYLRGMADMNGSFKCMSEDELHQDAIETVNGILEDDPNWLNEDW